MNDIYRKKGIILAAIVFASMTLVSILCLALKRDALQFHTRDYNYFIEQAARLTDPRLSKAFALNIEGYNLLGLRGIEGVQSLIHAIHAEYFRYTYVLLYGLFQDTLPIYLFYSLIFFAPILYFAILPRPKGTNAWPPVLLFTLLYILFPAALNTVTADLRPRLLFIPAWCLAILAVYYRRPFFEKLAFFVLLLSIREEGIVLGILVIAFNWLRMDHHQIAGQPGRWKQTFVFLALDLAAFAAFLAFMAWGGYDEYNSSFNPRLMLASLFTTYLPLTLAAGALIVLLVGFFLYKRRRQLNDLLLLLAYAAAIPLTGIQLIRDLPRWYSARSQIAPVTPWEVYLEAVTEPVYALVFYTLILGLVLLWDFTHGPARKFLVGALTTLCILFGATTLATIPPQVARWQQNLAPARLVWDFVGRYDRYETDVLVDYDTYQAFYHFDKTLVYNRLPLWDTTPEKRYYPQNKEAVARLIRQRIEYAVISRGSLKNVLEMAQMAGVPAVEVAANERYVVLEFRRT